MMPPIKTIQTLTLGDILPSSIARDANISAISVAVISELQAVIEAGPGIAWLSNLDTLPGTVLDLLAWQYHADLYDPAMDIADKRALLGAIIDIHSHAGTRAGVTRALDIVFGVGGYDIVEWFDDDPVGDPFTYKVIIHTAFTQADLLRARALVGFAGNVRSLWIGPLTWDNLEGLGDTWDDVDAAGFDSDQWDNYYYYGSA
jgi:phage tail P2-like protein